MTDETYNYITIGAGDARTFTLTLTDADGVAVDLTGATVLFRGKPQWDDDSYTFSVTCTVTDASGGVCTAALDADDTATHGIYVLGLNIDPAVGDAYSERCKDSDGVEYRLRIQEV